MSAEVDSDLEEGASEGVTLHRADGSSLKVGSNPKRRERKRPLAESSETDAALDVFLEADSGFDPDDEAETAASAIEEGSYLQRIKRRRQGAGSGVDSSDASLSVFALGDEVTDKFFESGLEPISERMDDDTVIDEGNDEHFADSGYESENDELTLTSASEIVTAVSGSGSSSALPMAGGSGDAKEAQVSFEMRDMDEGFYHSVRDMLGALDFDQKKLHVSQLADSIVAQLEVGGVLVGGEIEEVSAKLQLEMAEQSSEDETGDSRLNAESKDKDKESGPVFGFVSALSMRKYCEQLSVSHIRRFLVDRLTRGGRRLRTLKHRFEAAVCSERSGNVALVFEQRPVNCPLLLIYHIWNSLVTDIQWAADRSSDCRLPTAEKKLFDFDSVLLITRHKWWKKEEAPGIEGFKQLPKGISARKNQILVSEHIEDPLFAERAFWTHAFERSEDRVWIVCLIKWKDFVECVREDIKAQFGE